jgi:hypothetical protein
MKSFQILFNKKLKPLLRKSKKFLLFYVIENNNIKIEQLLFFYSYFD